jgi:uncharacterized protein YukE
MGWAVDDLEQIIELTNSIADPLERIRERQRLTRELYQRQAAEPFAAKVNRLIDEGSSVQEIAAQTGRAVEEVRRAVEVEDDDADDAEAFAILTDCAIELAPESDQVADDAVKIADTLERLADTWPNRGEGSETAARMRENARILRQHATRASPSTSPAPLRPIIRGPRPRGRRERHVARATSSADGGDDGGGSEPPLAGGLAICPVCTDLDLVHHLCGFCGGLGYVGRERRNRYKRGERP